jgi:hypothetical protein
MLILITGRGLRVVGVGGAFIRWALLEMVTAAAASEGGGEAEPVSIAVDTVFRRLHAKVRPK